MENADLRAKTSEFMSKNAVKTGKSYFPILCRKWVKRYTETAFWMQKRAKRTKKRRFLAQVENFTHITEIQRIMQNYIHF